MHKFRRRLTAVLAPLFAFVALMPGVPPATGNDAAVQLIRFGTFHHPPLSIREREGQLGGYLGEYLRAIERREPVRFELSYFKDADELYEAIAQERVQAGAPLFRETRAPGEPVRFTGPFENLPVAVFGWGGRSQQDIAFRQLRDKRLAVVEGVFMETEVRRTMPWAQVRVSPDEFSAFTALAANQVDYVVMGLSRAMHAINLYGLEHIVLTGYAPMQLKPVFAVHRDHPQVLALLRNAIDTLPTRDMHRHWFTPFVRPWYQGPDAWPWLVAANGLFIVALATLGILYYQLLRHSRRLRQTQHRLQRSETLYRGLAEATSELVTVHDEHGTVLYASPSARSLTGYETGELVGRSAGEMLSLDGSGGFHERLAMLEAGQGIRHDTFRLRRKDGSLRWFEVRASKLAEAGIAGQVLLVSRDVTERLASEERFRYQALHDALTGLPNRFAFSERLRESVDRAASSGSRLAVCLLDVDNFKSINDARGHATGDRVLRELGKRLLDIDSGRFVVSRISGDQFALLVRDSNPEAAAAPLAEQILAAVSTPIEIDDDLITMTGSVGVALYPDDAKSAEGLLSAADSAMFDAKSRGKNTWRRSARALGERSLARARALQNVRGAHKRGELELFYQPKVSLDDGHLCGVEALLRWRSPNGYQPPFELIEAAEESGFIKTLGRWVLEEAARQALTWAGRGFDFPIAVNVSAKQLHDRDFLSGLTELVQADRRLASRLELEVTETAIATDAPAVARLLAEIRSLGVRVHIDDFGTGYSSLSYLGRLPVDTLKIDRSLVSATHEAQDAREIVRAIIALASTLGLSTVAEGVETAQHAAFLKAAGCTQGQGYLYARPMPADEIEGFRAWPARSASA
ncbi:MAG TPA: EAL domain-containing protein [Burkholderiaceae bacterium]|nr:EAL domain-containing protein [Burkholderiaceae bacterium]